MYAFGEERPMALWGSLHGEEAVAGTPLTPVCYSTDQVKGVLTLQGDALSQAVSPPGPCPPTVLLMAYLSSVTS